MQLFVRFETKGYEGWKADFDAHGEDRDQSGLMLLQLWRDADDTTLAYGLFEAHDRKAAQGWIDRQAALKGGVSAQFMRTA
jgi:hypothetical protein